MFDPIMVSDPQSFAEYSLRNRFPPVIDKVSAQFPPTSKERVALEELQREVQSGVVWDPWKKGVVGTGPFHPAELSDWKREIASWEGCPWNKLPFYFAEAYLYLRILIAAGYYDEGSAYYGRDPFETQKEEELRGILWDSSWERTLEKTTEISQALLLSLKGNRMDLSNQDIAERGRGQLHQHGLEELLIDHSLSIAEHASRARRIDMVLDNAGSELLCDLYLSHLLLSGPGGPKVGGASPAKAQGLPTVVLHVKGAPFFVSDTTEKEVARMVEELGKSRQFSFLGKSLEGFMQNGQLQVKPHYFWNGPCYFPALPEELRQDFSHSDLVIFKGDANYRRLLEDRKWPFSTPLEEAVSWFPTNLAVLRMLKSELLVGISEVKARHMYKVDPQWLINGRWGIAHFVFSR